MAKKLSKNTPKKKFDIGGVGKINNLAPKPPIFTYPSGTYSPVGAPQGTITVTNEWGEPDRSYAPGAYERHIASKTPAEKKRNQFENIKPHDMIQFGLYGVDAMLRKNEAMRNQEAFNRRFRNVMTQQPLYDYNYMYGPDASGGTQYQNLIMAEDGAEIRRGTSPDITDVEVEGGEFLQLPDLSTQHVYGPSHEKGGVHTNLPEGTRVFSDHLKPIGSKKTYAQLAKKYDTEKYRKTLENPFANDIDRRTAKLLFEKNESILNELFEDQQKQNGNSDGTDQAEENMGMPQYTENPQMMGKFGLDLRKGEKLSFTNPFVYGGQYIGGNANFQQGGEYDLGYEDIMNTYDVYNPYNAYNSFNEYAPLAPEYGGGPEEVAANSMYQDGGMFPEDSTFYGATPGDTSVLTLGTDVEGEANFQGGGVKGRKKVGLISAEYQDTPPYEYKEESLPSMKERLKDALVRWNLDSKENLDKVTNAKNITDLGKIAGQVQKKVAAEQSAIAEDFGFRVPATQNGFKYLTSLGDEELKKILKDDALVKTVKSATAGSYSLPPEQRGLINQRITENLPSKYKRDYSVANFQDEQFYYRYPRVEQVEFDDKAEYEDYLKNVNVGGKYVADPKLGLYIEPTYKEPEKGTPKKDEVEEEQNFPGNIFRPVAPFKQMPSTLGEFPLYQAAPEALGYLAGLTPYNYYTPDYTHYEVAPPTLNLDAQLQSIDDSLQSALRQSTGNASLDASRKSALFNQALAAKQQAFQTKQNYDAEARFKADLYNVGERTKENYMDVNAASQIYNDYMAAAQDAAERERIGAVSSLTKKTGDFYADEFAKVLAISTLAPNLYYEGKDLRNPIKVNPYAEEFYSKMAGRYKTPGQKTSPPMGAIIPTQGQMSVPENVAPYVTPMLPALSPELRMNTSSPYNWGPNPTYPSTYIEPMSYNMEEYIPQDTVMDFLPGTKESKELSKLKKQNYLRKP